MVTLSSALLAITLLYTPSGYEGYFAFTGRKAKRENIISDCRMAIESKESFEKFCKRAKWALGKKTTFCMRTGFSSENRCVDIIIDNTRKGNVIQINSSGYIVSESYR